MNKKIAVIGGGGAGAVAAWAMRNHHDVTLYESENCLGGHAYSHPVKTNVGCVNVDLGVEYFSEKQAPNFMSLLEAFNIDTYVAPLSFSAFYANDKEINFWSNKHLSEGFSDELRSECARFHEQMYKVINLHSLEVKHVTLGDFLRREKYSDHFIYKALLPLLTTFSSCKAPILDYSLMFCAVSFNLGLLSFFHPSYWRKSCEGINSYLTKIQALLAGKVKLNCPVQKIERCGQKVLVYESDRHWQTYDEVIIATHADLALKLLDKPSPTEKEILGSFEYSHIESVLHSDSSIFECYGNIKSLDSYCIFHGDNPEISDFPNGSLTRVINNLPIYNNIEQPLYVTFDPKQKISPDLIFARKSWKLPVLRPRDMINKRKLQRIQGKNKVWFCGTDTSLSGHEGAILSGLVIAERLGAPYPFAHNNWAKLQFDIVKGLMGVYRPSERLTNYFTGKIYAIAKLLKLQQSQMSKVFLDLYG